MDKKFRKMTVILEGEDKTEILEFEDIRGIVEVGHETLSNSRCAINIAAELAMRENQPIYTIKRMDKDGNPIVS